MQRGACEKQLVKIKRMLRSLSLSVCPTERGVWRFPLDMLNGKWSGVSQGLTLAQDLSSNPSGSCFRTVEIVKIPVVLGRSERCLGGSWQVPVALGPGPDTLLLDLFCFRISFLPFSFNTAALVIAELASR